MARQRLSVVLGWLGFFALSGGGLACAGSNGSGAQASGGVTATGGTAAGGITAAGGNANTGGSGPTEPCPELTVDLNEDIGGMMTDRYTFSDAACRPRSAAMQQGGRGFLRQFTYEHGGGVRVVTGTGVNGHDGFGRLVNHGLSLSGGSESTSRAAFVGRHHAIYEYTNDMQGLLVTRHWFFASGRNHPLFAVTYDASAVDPGLNADTRTPYGDLAFDGDDNASSTVISGAAWGDRYKFITTSAPLTLNSSWDYTEPNLVPYCMLWVDAADAEMGLVQSQTWQQKDAGGYWHYKNWGKTSANQVRDEGQLGQMPISWNWTYQLNQYELCFEQGTGCVDSPTGSHRISWGSNYGAVGGGNASGNYPAYGDDKQLSGYPFQSYSVFMVLGSHSGEPVFGQMREIEVVQKTALTATVGSVVDELPPGVGRTDTAKLNPTGYDARYASFNVRSAGNQAAFSIAVAEGSLQNPVVVVWDYTADELPTVKINGATAQADVHFLPSLDSENQKLWVTFRRDFTGTTDIAIE